MAKSESNQLGKGVLVPLLRGVIRGYQLLPHFWGPRCRFYPSCSEYMRDALQAFGFWKGLSYGLVRILKCHPWHPGGVDYIEVSHGK